jgi:nicotinate-nucleotide pyrophosphorylase (carboxylating)
MNYHEFLPIWKNLLQTGLKDDGWPWDFTSKGIPERKIKSQVIAKSSGIWAASTLTDALNALAPEMSTAKGFAASSLLEDGIKLKPGMVVAELVGPASLVLAFERPYLNLASYVSGVATATENLVSIVRKACRANPPRVSPTRKTLPGYRDVAILGVEIGGGVPHRMNLAAGVLIKENHIASAGGIHHAVNAAREVAPHLLRIEVEVRNEKELAQAIESSADVVMLDNFTPEQVKKALLVIEKSTHRPLVEVSGGINEATIGQYALSGVDIISVGALTHSVKALDLSLLVK